MSDDQPPALTAHAAKQIADAHLAAVGSRLRAILATREGALGVWRVDYHDPANPDEMLDGGSLVVTDTGDVHNLGSTPTALIDLMLDLGVELRMESTGEPDTAQANSEPPLDPAQAAGQRRSQLLVDRGRVCSTTRSPRNTSLT